MYRVLQVTPELNAGGVERTTIEMADAISRAGGLALVASAGGRLEADLETAGGELIRLPLKSKNPIEMTQNALRLAQVAALRDVNIIHARSRAPAWSALWAARHLKLPFVTTYHGIYNARSSLKRFYNSVMAKGDIVIANSEYTRTHVLETYDIDPERVISIPRGVDLAVFNPAHVSALRIAQIRATWGMSENDTRFVLIMPARLTRWKGQLVLIEAAARLTARRGNVLKLVFAGDEQGRSGYVREMMDAISAGGLQMDVAIVGHLRHIAEALAASDAAAFPSTDPEAFGRGSIEAQAMGKPVIIAGHGGLAETIIDGETGISTLPGSASALEAAIEHLIDIGPEGRARMGGRARTRVSAKFTTEALQKATLAVYDEVLGAKA